MSYWKQKYEEAVQLSNMRSFESPRSQELAEISPTVHSTASTSPQRFGFDSEHKTKMTTTATAMSSSQNSAGTITRLQMPALETHLSNDPSHDTDMDDILAPSMTMDSPSNNKVELETSKPRKRTSGSETYSSDLEQQPSGLSSAYSEDSIIKRVEEEIAAARQAAASAKSRLGDDTSLTQKQQPQTSLGGGSVSVISDNDDMKKILDVYGDEHSKTKNEDAASPGKQMSSLEAPKQCGSYEKAMDLFEEEFDDVSGMISMDDNAVDKVEKLRILSASRPSNNNDLTPQNNDQPKKPASETDGKKVVTNVESEPILSWDEIKADVLSQVASDDNAAPFDEKTPTETKDNRTGKNESTEGISESTEIEEPKETEATEPVDAASSAGEEEEESSERKPAVVSESSKEDVSVEASNPSSVEEATGEKPVEAASAAFIKATKLGYAIDKREIAVRHLARRRKVDQDNRVDSDPGGDLSGRSEQKANQAKEEFYQKSRRIRFRDPFPVLKPPKSSRASRDIILAHTTGTPTCTTEWIRPTKTLKQLIVATMGSSLQRRGNACGAIKVLTLQKKNRSSLVRTDSFLSALIFAAAKDIPSKERTLALDARTRAIAAIRNVTEPKDNRLVVFTYPGLLECLVKVTREDTGEARLLACETLTLLAKTPECREDMAKTAGLIGVLADVLRGAVPSRTRISSEEEKKDEVDGNEKEDEGSYSSQNDQRSQDVDEAGSVLDSSSLSSNEEDRREQAGSKRYDSIRKQNEEKLDEHLQRARTISCAVLLHLSKSCGATYMLCSSTRLLDSLVIVSRESENPIHTKTLEILGNLTRLTGNNGTLTRCHRLVDTLVLAAEFKTHEDRLSALRALQNLAADSSSRSRLAESSILTLLTTGCMRKDHEEKEAALSALYNLITEPAAIVAITNTKNLVASLVHLAHNPDSSSTIRLKACEALATISLWLQTLAGTGKVPEGHKNVPLPSQKTTGWERWD